LFEKKKAKGSKKNIILKEEKERKGKLKIEFEGWLCLATINSVLLDVYTENYVVGL
jgi:hypothetical protein